MALVFTVGMLEGSAFFSFLFGRLLQKLRLSYSIVLELAFCLFPFSEARRDRVDCPRSWREQAAPLGLQPQLHSLMFLQLFRLNHVAKLNLPLWKLAQFLSHSSVLHRFIASLELENNDILLPLYFSVIRVTAQLKKHLWVFSFFFLSAAPLQQSLEAWEETAFLNQSFPFKKAVFLFLCLFVFSHWTNLISVFVE